MIKTKKRSNKKILVLIILGAILLAGGGVFLYQKSHKYSPSTTVGVQKDAARNQNGVDMSPATKKDQDRADAAKDKIVDKQKLGTPPSSDKKTVTPTVTYADQYGTNIEIGSYVGGVYEDGGTCTATFTQISTSFTRSVAAIKNVSSVDCPVITVPVEAFTPKGTWNMTLSYASSTAAGSAATKQIEVK